MFPINESVPVCLPELDPKPDPLRIDPLKLDPLDPLIPLSVVRDHHLEHAVEQSRIIILGEQLRPHRVREGKFSPAHEVEALDGHGDEGLVRRGVVRVVLHENAEVVKLTHLRVLFFED